MYDPAIHAIIERSIQLCDRSLAICDVLEGLGSARATLTDRLVALEEELSQIQPALLDSSFHAGREIVAVDCFSPTIPNE